MLRTGLRILQPEAITKENMNTTPYLMASALEALRCALCKGNGQRWSGVIGLVRVAATVHARMGGASGACRLCVGVYHASCIFVLGHVCSAASRWHHAPPCEHSRRARARVQRCRLMPEFQATRQTKFMNSGARRLGYMAILGVPSFTHFGSVSEGGFGIVCMARNAGREIQPCTVCISEHPEQ
jgi:hypothetical protein